MPNYVGIQPARPMATQDRVTYVASEGQTAFPASYSPGYVDVYVNGSKLSSSAGIDFDALDGIVVNLKVPCSLGDTVEIVGIHSSTPYDFYTKAQTDAKLGIFYGVASGTANALEVITSPEIPALSNGTEVRVRTSLANTSTTPTITLTNLGITKTITAGGNQPVVAGMWGAGQELTLRYNATADKMEVVSTGFGIATTAEAIAGTATNVVLTPANLSAMFTGQRAVTGNGYQKLPGGLILQWGSYTETGLPIAPGGNQTRTITYPIAFPTNNLVTVACTTLNFLIAGATITTATNFQLVFSVPVGHSGNLNLGAFWTAIGY